jgi:hypothetical protein
MDEVLLQTIIEKLEAFEAAQVTSNKAILTEGTNAALLNELKTFEAELNTSSKILKTSNNSLNEMMRKLDAWTAKLNEPVRKKITYHLNKSTWISVGLFLGIMLLMMTNYNTCNKLKIYESNDIKYRWMKVKAGKELRKAIYNLDSSFNADPETLRKLTIQEEDRLAEQARLFQLAGEKENEAEELTKKAETETRNGK